MGMRYDEDVYIKGTATITGGLNAPAGCITDANIEAEAGVDSEKLEHQHQPGYAQESATNAADESRVIFVAKGAGTIVSFVAGNVVTAIGDSTCTVDLKKNGTTVLSGAVSLSAGSPVAYGKTAGTVSVTSYAAGDVISVTIDATAGTGTLAKGIFCMATLREAANA